MKIVYTGPDGKEVTEESNSELMKGIYMLVRILDERVTRLEKVMGIINSETKDNHGRKS